jgi:hypothetical protein
MALILKYVCATFGNASPVTYGTKGRSSLFKSEPNLIIEHAEKYL